MRKKFLAMLLGFTCALGCAFGFTACGGGDDNTGDGGNGGDKTEQSAPNDKTEQTIPNEKPNDGDKTEQIEKPNDSDKKPDNSDENKTDDDKTGDDKTDDDKKPDDSGDDKTVDQAEAFRAITDALQAKLDDKYGAGAEILTIYTYAGDGGRRNYLGLKIKYGNAIKEVESALANSSWLDKNNNITDTNQAVRLITNSPLTERVSKEFVGLYFTDGNDIIAEKMIEARVGKNYDIIYGAVSDITEVTNGKQFKVYALIADNDGKVYEFTETLVVTGAGNAYDTVINEIRGNFDSPEHTQTELGALADRYYEVMR